MYSAGSLKTFQVLKNATLLQVTEDGSSRVDTSGLSEVWPSSLVAMHHFLQVNSIHVIGCHPPWLPLSIPVIGLRSSRIVLVPSPVSSPVLLIIQIGTRKTCLVPIRISLEQSYHSAPWGFVCDSCRWSAEEGFCVSAQLYSQPPLYALPLSGFLTVIIELSISPLILSIFASHVLSSIIGFLCL